MLESGYGAAEMKSGARKLGHYEPSLEDTDGLEGVRAAFRKAFISRWARLAIAGEHTLFEEDWSSTVDEIAREVTNVAGGELSTSDEAVRIYFSQHRLANSSALNVVDTPMTVDCFEKEYPGPALRAVLQYVYNHDCRADGLPFVKGLLKLVAKQEPLVIASDAATKLNACLSHFVPEAPAEVQHDSQLRNMIPPAALWVGLVSAESGAGVVNLYIEALNERVGGSLLFRLMKTRLAIIADAEGVELSELADDDVVSARRFSKRELASLDRRWPSWVSAWTTYEVNLICEPCT